MALVGPQLQGPHVVEYAVLPHRGAWHDADLHAAADELLVPLERTRVLGDATAVLPPHGHGLAVEGGEVSAVRREDGALVVRVYNPRPERSTLHIARNDRAVGGEVVDLRGRPITAFRGTLDLGSGQIATLRLAAD